MSINGMATYGRSRGYISLSNLPDAKPEHSLAYDRLDGGLNIFEMEYRLNPNESPEMKNLMWVDGALGCRDGQTWVSDDNTLGEGFACFQSLYGGYMFFHIGEKIYCADPGAASFTLTELMSGVPEVRGTFFRYQDWLFYKTRGAYIKIARSPEASVPFAASSVAGFVPVTYINCSPTNGAGDSYQPENRIQGTKTVWYNATTMTRSKQFTGDGTTAVFTLEFTSASQARLASVDSVYIGATSASTSAYTVDLATGTITFAAAPAASSAVSVLFSTCVYEYCLPVIPDSVTQVSVDGVVLTPVTDYTVDLGVGWVTFVHGPAVTDPATNNTVKVTYTKANPDAYNSIMDCGYATVYGGDQNVCVVMAGCAAQPNAYFWNGNNIAMDPSYFPMEQYNLAGDTKEAITGFGKQQDYLIIFKETSVGRTVMGTTEVNGRTRLEMPYTRINDKIGCDLPWTIQLVRNNLVWCNTLQGIHYLADSSPAYENNVVLISRKVNGSEYQAGELAASRDGLLRDVRSADHGAICSLDDDSHYWLVANGHAYVWDYQLSTYSEPSWFYFTNINAVAWCLDGEQKKRHLNVAGQVTVMNRTYADYADPIEKVYQFPVQNFGSYDRYKTVSGVIFVVRSDTDTQINIKYRTDWEERYDLTPISAYGWRLVPRNLTYRFLGVPRYSTIARRRPGCRNIRHFSMRLENSQAGSDLSIISAQVFYKFQGRQR